MRRLPCTFACLILVLAAGLSGQTWTRLVVTDANASWHVSMTADTHRKKLVRIGGNKPWNPISSLIWEFDGSRWNLSGGLPIDLMGESITYDAARRECVIAGGYWVDNYAGGHVSADTVLYRGPRRTVIKSPSWRPRYGHCAAYDSRRQLVVVHAGGVVFPYRDTWVWNGSTWRRIYGIGPARFFAEMVYDPIRDVMVLFGGTNSSRANPTVYDETWEFDGAKWRQIQTPNRPRARWGHSMAYVPGKGVVLHGGCAQDCFGGSSAVLGDTWLYQGQDWKLVLTSTGPSPRYLSDMTTDWNGDAILFGGDAAPSALWKFDLGKFGGHYGVFGAGCPGGAGDPLIGGNAPRINDRFTLSITQARAQAMTMLVFSQQDLVWNGLALPYDLTPLGFPGCNLHVGLEALFAVQATAGGVASVSLTLPNNLSLFGTRFVNQGFVFDGRATGGLSVTNAGAGVIGR